MRFLSGVTLDQFLPPSRVICTRPSSLPVQIVPACTGDSVSVKIVSEYSTLLVSFVIGPPDDACFDLSLRVRSGLMICQLLPSSVDLKSTLAAVYSVFGSCAEKSNGKFH